MNDFRPDFRRKTTDLVDFLIGKIALPPPPSSSMLTFTAIYYWETAQRCSHPPLGQSFSRETRGHGLNIEGGRGRGRAGRSRRALHKRLGLRLGL